MKRTLKAATGILTIGAVAAVVVIACKTPGSSTVQSEGVGDDDGTYAGGYRGPPGGLPVAKNFALWQEYCAGDKDVAKEVLPNYGNKVVMDAAQILSRVNKESFAMYGDILAFHKTAVPAAAAGAGVSPQAHDFLSYLCGEFRDRAPMIKAKIDWVFNMRYLAKSDGDTNVSCAVRNNPMNGDTSGGGGGGELPKFDPKGSPWAQMCLEDYDNYYMVTRAYYDAKQSAIEYDGGLEMEDGSVAKGKLAIGKIKTIDRYVPAMTICETKYIMAEYVKKGVQFGDGAEGLKKFKAGYDKFESLCSAEDKDWYYDFRGDANYKPNSPEGNGMIWFARSIGRMCETRVKAKAGMPITDAECRRYFERPFYSRYTAARAGLAAWLLQTPDLEEAMKDTGGTYYTIVMQNTENPKYVFGDKGPYLFRINDQFNGSKIAGFGTPGKLMAGWKEAWGSKDMGLSKLSGLSGDALKELIYRRIRNAVDRHTDWYHSGYDSAPDLPSSKRERMQNNQAYSAFVASSYEMSESNNFTSCGITIPCGDRPPEYTQHKQWMFIFKVKKSNWIKPEDIAAGQTELDFDRHWFDETAFGDTGLANSERAWDRLGSPMEDEHAEILYLYRIPN